MKIEIFKPDDKDGVIELVLHCQNDGAHLFLTVYDQPDILNIEQSYIKSGGNFWVAKENGKVAGTIGLMNKGNGIGILKKFFVYEPFRGKPYNLGQSLFAALMGYAHEHDFTKIILDTPKNTQRAHRFYEKAGFRMIERQDIPFEYDYPYEDSDFFCLDI